MILSELDKFAKKTALSTAATGRAVVGSTINLGPVVRDIGAGKALFLVITVDAAVTSGGSATVSFELVSDGQDPVLTDGTATLHFKSMDIPKATLIQGYEMVIPLPSIAPAYEQYLGLIANVGVAALTAGQISASITQDPTGWKAYPRENS